MLISLSLLSLNLFSFSFLTRYSIRDTVLILALLGQVLLFIPLVIMLPQVLGLGLWGVWIAYPAADILSVVLTVLFLRNELKKMSLCLW